MMKCRINYPKVISQVDSIKNNVSELSAQIKILNQDRAGLQRCLERTSCRYIYGKIECSLQ